MRDTFNLYRFSLLFKKTILERPMQLLGLMALTLLVSLAIFAIGTTNGAWQGAHAQSFLWGYLGGGTILSSVVFGYFNTNASGSAYFMLPASTFEKWLCGILIAGVLFTCIFLGFYRLMDICFVYVYHNSLDKTAAHYQQLYGMARIYAFDGMVPKVAYILFANFGGAMLLGSLYYNRANLIKTALTILGTIAFVLLVNYLIAYAIFGKISSANPFGGVSIQTPTFYSTVMAPEYISNFAEILVEYIVPIILWTTAYIRLREKEI